MDDVTVREIPREEYERFLHRTPHSAFHRTALLDAVATVFILRIRWLGYFRDETLLAVTPLMGRRMGPLTIWGSPLRKCAIPAATLFCSPPECAADLLPCLRTWLARQRLGYVQVTIPDGETPRPTNANLVEPLDNLELDLRPRLDAIWKSLSDLPKRCVRKAVRNAVRIHWRNSTAMLATQRELVAATYDKQGIHPNIPERLYAELLRHRTETGLCVICATHAGKTVATIWVLADSDKCYYWDAAALAESRDLNANHLLVWCLVRWAHRKGIKTLDFVGAGLGRDIGTRPGIGRFKRSMGATLVSYRVVYWYSSLMRVALAGYRFVNRLRARLHKVSRNPRVNHD